MSYWFHQVSIIVLFMFILFHLSKQSQDNTYLMKDRFTLLVSLFPHWSSKDTNTIVHQELKWKYPVDFFKANTRIMAGESSGWIYILMIYDRQWRHCTPQVFSTYRANWLKIPRHTSPQRQSLHIFWAGKMNSHISHRWVLVEQDLANGRTLS